MDRQPLWTGNFVLLLFANLFLFLAFEMLIPTLPLFAEGMGATESQIGMVTGIFTFSAVLIRPFTGTLTSRFGRKGLLLMSTALCLGTTVAYGWTDGIGPIVAVRLLHGVGFGLATNLFAAMVSDLLPANRRGEGVGHFTMGETLAISLGPLFGVGLLGSFDFHGLFLAGGLILLVSLAMSGLTGRSRTPAEAATAAGEERPVGKPSILSDMIERRVLLPSALAVLLGLTVGAVVSFITVYAQARGIGHVEWFLFTNAMAGLLIRFVSGPLFDRKGPGSVLIPAAVCSLIGNVLVSAASDTASLIAAAVFCGMGVGAAFPALQAWCLHLVPAHRREAAIGTFFNAFDLGIGIGSMLAGVLAGWIGYSPMYLCSAGVFVVYLTVYMSCAIRRRKGQSAAAKGKLPA